MVALSASVLNCDTVWVLLTWSTAPITRRCVRRGEATTADELMLFDDGFLSCWIGGCGAGGGTSSLSSGCLWLSDDDDDDDDAGGVRLALDVIDSPLVGVVELDADIEVLSVLGRFSLEMSVFGIGADVIGVDGVVE